MGRKKIIPGQGSFSFDGIDWDSYDTSDLEPNRKHAGALPRAHRPGIPKGRTSNRPQGARKLPTAAVFTQETDTAPLPWHHLGSSRVMSARYDPGNTQIHVYFRDGTPWVYEDVPYQIYEAFITASSPGRFVGQVLDQYPYRRAEPSEMENW